METKRILAVGSVALDSVRTPFGRVKDALGGSATYFSASARFFAPVSVVGVVGNDFPKKYFKLIKDLGVDTRSILVRKGKTFRWSGSYDFDLNTAHTLKTELNVFRDFRPVLSGEARSSRFVFLANIDPDLQAEVLGQVYDPWLVACDTMNFWIEKKRNSLRRLLKRVDVFLCNDSEAREFSGEYNLAQAAKRILDLGPRLLLIKKGEHGVICFSRSFVFLAPAYLLEKVFDPTGAGDSFAGGFMGYLTRSRYLSGPVVRQAVIYGSVLASYNVESFGPGRLAKLRLPEIQSRYDQFKRMTAF